VVVIWLCLETSFTRASTLLSWAALWALGFVRVSVRARNEGCGSGSSLTTGKYDMIINLAHAMLAGRSLEAFLMERLAQEATNIIRKAKDQTLHTPTQIYDYAIFELAICAFDIQSGWRDAYERQREYMIKYIFMGKLNPEKFSQRLQDLNRYLDYITIEKTSEKDKIIKAYGASLPEDEIRSIMGRAIPPEWKVNLLALGKEPCRFKDREDQLNMYRQQWQADQQKQIIAKMA
jgi:hypothetical protein